MTITGQSSLSKDSIDKMIRDAEAHADEDRRRRDEAEARNNADTLVYQTEKLLREQGDKITGEEKSTVERRLEDLKAALAGQDVELIKSTTEGLMTASQTFTQKLYDQAAAADRQYMHGETPTGDGEQPSDDDVVDAEIVDEEEGKSA